MRNLYTDGPASGRPGLFAAVLLVVAVFGLGGVGSHCAEALARSGVGTLFLIDSDTVAPSNINRQSIALLSTVGQKKTDVMKEKIADINPECSVFTSSAFVLRKTSGRSFPPAL